MTAGARPLRLFFALWPDDAARAALERWSAAIHRVAGGRATRGDSIHLTLAFLGDCDPDRLGELKAAAAGVRVRPFELALDEAGSGSTTGSRGPAQRRRPRPSRRW